jgi:hypothetical protein
MDDLLGHSITYLVAVGPRAGQKVFSLQTVPACASRAEGELALPEALCAQLKLSRRPL